MGDLDIFNQLLNGAYNNARGLQGSLQGQLGNPMLSGLQRQNPMNTMVYPGLAQAFYDDLYNRELYNPYAFDLHPDAYEKQEWDNYFIIEKRKTTDIYNYNDLELELKECKIPIKENAIT